MFQIKEQDKTPEELSEVEIGNLSNTEFKVIIIKMFKNLREVWMNRVRSQKFLIKS